MSPQRGAHIGLLSALTVLATCMTIVVRGSFWPGSPTPLALGDQVPAIALPDISGTMIDLGIFRGRFVLIVFTKPQALSPLQQTELARQSRALCDTAPMSVIAVTPIAGYGISPESICPGVSQILVDKQRTVAELVGLNADPSICLIDPDGQLRYRAALPEDQVPVMTHIRDLVDESPYVLATQTKP